MKRKIAAATIALALVGVLIALAGCGSSGSGSESVPSNAVAVVGGKTIPKSQFDQLVAQAQAQLKLQGQTFPKVGSKEYTQYAVQIVDYLVKTQIVEQSAAKLGVSVSPQEVSDYITKITQQYGGKKAFDAMLKQAGMTSALLDWTIRSELLTQKVQSKVASVPKVTEAQIKAYWDAHKATLGQNKATSTLAKAKTTITETLASAAQDKLWTAWLQKRSKELDVKYGKDYDPVLLHASPSPSPTG